MRLRALGCLFVASLSLAGLVRADPYPNFEVSLHDGSRIVAQSTSPNLPFRAAIAEDLELDWTGVESLLFADEKVVAKFFNGDRLSGTFPDKELTVDTLLGQISIPGDQIKAIKEIKISSDRRDNIALGKTVSGQGGASHGKEPALYVTDGDYSTRAYPSSFQFDYTVDLRTDAVQGFPVGEIVIHWGHFGDRFKGVPRGEGWAPGAWPGDYVKSYRLEYRSALSDHWVELHQSNGRPADEDRESVKVEKKPAQENGHSSEVTTTITDLKLENVAEIRIHAQGGHWIGLFELEIFSESSQTL